MTNRVRISVDCVCDLPRRMWEELELSIMFFYITTEEGRFRDIEEVNSENMVEYLEQGKRAHSRCASAEEYKQHFLNIRKEHDGPIIHICIARYVSGSYDSACEAAENMENVWVVDSGHLSGGMSLMVISAAEMAKAGAGCELILQELEDMRNRVCTSFVVDSTDCLYTNGKISGKIDTFCKTFSLHPVLKLKDSRMGAAGICIGNMKRYARSYIRKVLKHPETIDTDMVFIVNAGCSYEFMSFVKEEIQKRVKWKRLIICSASATVTCNCGAGTFGVLYTRKKVR